MLNEGLGELPGDAELARRREERSARKVRGRMTDIEFEMLRAMLPRPLHGYAIQKEVRAATHGEVKLGFGTLYAALHRLLEDGMIQPEPDQIVEGRLRRSYRVTGLGQQAVEQKEAVLRGMLRPYGAAQPQVDGRGADHG